MSVSIGSGAVGIGACVMNSEGTFYGGEHKNLTYNTPNGGKISVEGLTVLSYSEPPAYTGYSWFNAVGKNITITDRKTGKKYKYQGIGGQLFENDVLVEPTECKACKNGKCLIHKTDEGWTVV